MTNQQIVSAYKQEQNIPLDTPLYTYGVWLKQGYRVRKGEKCKHRVQMWKYTESKIGQDGEKKTVGRCFHKVVNLFDETQVTKM